VWGGKGLFAGLYLHGDGFRQSVEGHRHASAPPLHPYRPPRNVNPSRAHCGCARGGFAFCWSLYGCRGDPIAWRWLSTDFLKPSPCKYNPANSPLPPHTGAALQMTCIAAVWVLGAQTELRASQTGVCMPTFGAKLHQRLAFTLLLGQITRKLHIVPASLSSSLSHPRSDAFKRTGASWVMNRRSR
jgi:hypothetical protein